MAPRYNLRGCAGFFGYERLMVFDDNVVMSSSRMSRRTMASSGGKAGVVMHLRGRTGLQGTGN